MKVPIDVHKSAIFYHLRNSKNQPRATVCLMRIGDDFSRGISICSPSDQFDKDYGRKLAADRALRGIRIIIGSEKPPTKKQIRLKRERKKYISIDIIARSEAWDSLNQTPTPRFFFKTSTFDERLLTDFEMHLIKKRGERTSCLSI